VDMVLGLVSFRPFRVLGPCFCASPLSMCLRSAGCFDVATAFRRGSCAIIECA
jgi:hypothetical protein